MITVVLVTFLIGSIFGGFVGYVVAAVMSATDGEDDE